MLGPEAVWNLGLVSRSELAPDPGLVVGPGAEWNPELMPGREPVPILEAASNPGLVPD